MFLTRLRPPRELNRRLFVLSRFSLPLSQQLSLQSVTRRQPHQFFSTVQPAATSTSTIDPSPSPSPFSPVSSLLTSFLAHPPPSPLPSSLLTSAAVLSAELRLLHRSVPFFAGFSSQLPLSGSHVTVECGGVSVVLVRGEDELIRALFNNCTHQNARICASSRPDLAVHSLPSSVPITSPPLQSAPTCHYATRLVCPFHHWTFALDGQHLAPRTALTRDPEQRKSFALRRATVEELDGVLWVTMKVETAEPMADESLAEVEEARQPLQQRLAGKSHTARGSLLLQHNWKHVIAALSQQPNTIAVFPSALYTPHPTPLLLQLLPLSQQMTAVTAYGVGSEGSEAAATSGGSGEEEWKQWAESVVSGSGVTHSGLEGRHGAQYYRLMVRGLGAEVEIEEQKRKDVEARRNKLLGLQ